MAACEFTMFWLNKLKFKNVSQFFIKLRIYQGKKNCPEFNFDLWQMLASNPNPKQ